MQGTLCIKSEEEKIKKQDKSNSGIPKQLFGETEKERVVGN